MPPTVVLSDRTIKRDCPRCGTPGATLLPGIAGNERLDCLAWWCGTGQLFTHQDRLRAEKRGWKPMLTPSQIDCRRKAHARKLRVAECAAEE